MKSKKTEIRVLSKTLMVQLGVPVEVGPIKLTNVFQVSIYHSSSNGIEFDIDDYDYQDITYMGMKIESDYKSFSKFKEFHMGIGIDLNKLINDEAARIFPPEMMTKWIEDNVTELMKK